MTKKIMAFGAFDLLHEGHTFFLMEAKKYGDLTVVIARDINIVKFKQEKPMHSESTRKKEIEDLNIADRVLIGDKKEFLKTILENFPDIICLGYDQKFPTKDFEEKLKKIAPNLQIIRIAPHDAHIFKSSILKKSLKS